MKILCICQYYYPEPFRISDVCEELVKRGHQVTVVTGTPNYPMGEIYDGYENNRRSDEIINGVNVHRCNIIPRKTGLVHRFLNYYSYPLKSCSYIDKLDDDFDVVFINQLSPVMMARAGIRYAEKHNVRSVLYCLDLWPESLVAGGIDRSSAIYGFFHKESKKIYKAVDKILVTSRSFSDYFKKEFGIDNVDYLPQFAEDIFSAEECRKKDDGFKDIMFAGNVGKAQCIDTILDAAAQCADIKNLRWHIVGDGIELDAAKKRSSELGLPVVFHGRQPIEKMPEYYSMADAMLVTLQKDDVLSLTLPGKVQSYMAAGKLIIGAADGETQTVIKDAGCGFCADAENVDELCSAVREFVSLGNEQTNTLGANAVNYYERVFSKQKYINNLEIYLSDTK